MSRYAQRREYVNETLIFDQEQGDQVKLVVNGDEFYASHETEEGYTVVCDSDLGQFCYAILLEGMFASSGVPMSQEPPVGLRRHLKESSSVRNAQFEQRYAQLRPVETEINPHIFRTRGRNRGLLTGRRVSEGKVKGLTVLVEFTDVTTDITKAEVEDLLNGDNYRDNGNFCSVREYFRLMSGGELDYTNVVVGPIKLSHNRLYYQSNLLVKEALDKAVNQFGINLADFDSNGDGVIDAVNFMYAGRTVYQGELWPHNFSIELFYGNVKTHFYMITSLGRRRVDLSIGTFCHETGHLLCRWPDLYDYGTRDGDFENSAGIGRYCLMGSGNHNNNGHTPSPVCAYLRDLVGWTEQEISLNTSGIYEARHGDYGTILRYETDKPNEYFLIENRTQLGLDAYLPDNGLAVYHCDTMGSNEWQGGTPERHYQCGLLQADGHLDLENNRNLGDAGDLFGQVRGVSLSYATKPSSQEWDRSDSGLIIANITIPGEIIRFEVGKLPPIITQTVRADLLIPDYQPLGVTSSVEIPQQGKVKKITVTIDITHTYIGDLRLELEAPFGQVAMLHNQTGGSQRDLRETYSSDDRLSVFINELIKGTWKLHVKDLLRRDTGRLNQWKLEIEYEPTEQVISKDQCKQVAIAT
ncbi:MAG: M6 family metalloprotease domain-containing protein [Okeania sp. SIO2C2]|uniref:M6 family metalloprotease domain-containing protein n=1 Tax=Okeania sp. SIO2C2 TaxID=2607787 RepID=UPI0013B6925B|nr:M6 family metalloprotease domain-containing protein [Okeania sp. SIO2C2]NEP86291.1 M6 family metalloprotease domain-containing protein [Okeania sp. SIO2C2]